MNIDEMPAKTIADSRFWFPAIHDRQMVDSLDMGALMHFALGIAGEVGELVNVIKKMNRDQLSGLDTSETKRFLQHQALSNECADVLIYLMDIMAVLNIVPSEAYQTKHKELVARWGKPK